MAASTQNFQNTINLLRAHIQACSVAVEQLSNQHWAEVGTPVAPKSILSGKLNDPAKAQSQFQDLRFGGLDSDVKTHGIQVPSAASAASFHEVDVPNECDELLAKPVHQRVGAHSRIVVPGHAGMPIGMALAMPAPLTEPPLLQEESSGYHEMTDNTKNSSEDEIAGLPRELPENSVTPSDMVKMSQEGGMRKEGSAASTDSAHLAEWSMEITPIWLEKKKRNQRRVTTKPTTPSEPTHSKSKLHFSRSRSMVGSMRSDASLDRRSNFHMMDGKDVGAFLTTFVASPTSTRRLVWDIAGMFFIGYDLVAIPFQTFDPPKNWFTNALSMITTIFWTIDIPCSFLVGYHKDGFIEMSIASIANRYARTWLSFDVLVIAIDWTSVIMTWISDDQGGVQDDVSLVRLGKSARFLRVMRLLRLLKVHGRLAEIFERMQSEIVRIALGIIKNVVLIILANHVFACGFWGIGTIDDSWERTWVKKFNMTSDRSIAYQYTTSLHWSLTQFTPASMEVVPRNELERAYTVLVLLLAMITFSSFISSLTNAMTQLRNLNSDRNAQQLMLRKYIMQNSVPTSLATRVWSWLQSNPGKVKDRIHESDVVILSSLPSSLQAEMQDQVFRPALISHPFFFQFSFEFAGLMKRLFRCLKEVSIGLEKELFHFDMVSDQMYFVISGTLLYQECVRMGKGALGTASRISTRSSGVGSMAEVGPGKWLCEPSLWTRWKHRGVAVTKTHVELFGMIATEFQKLMQIELRDCWQAARYARLFVKIVKERKIYLTDIWADFDTLQELAQRAFEDDEEQAVEERLHRSFTFQSHGSRERTDGTGSRTNEDIMEAAEEKREETDEVFISESNAEKENTESQL